MITTKVEKIEASSEEIINVQPIQTPKKAADTDVIHEENIIHEIVSGFYININVQKKLK